MSHCADTDDGLDAFRLGSITCRIATGKQAVRKVVTLQTQHGDARPLGCDSVQTDGFLLQAGVAAPAHESQTLEHVRRCIARSVISEQRATLPKVLRWLEKHDADWGLAGQ